MTPQQEREFEKKAERELSGHRGLQDGRDFRWNCFRFRDENDDFRRKFDVALPDAPDSKQWWERFCPECGKLPHWCECGEGMVDGLK